MDYEPITKELREYATLLHGEGSAAKARLDEMCDNIDAIHRSLEQENERLRDASEHGDDWIKLPVDADGVPIWFGDKVTVPWSKKVYEVSGFSCTQQLASGKRTIWVDVYSLEKMGNVPLCGANSCHHYHAPTVEDVMVEFATDWECSEDGEDKTAVLKEYAAKLRLAGDAE